MSWQGAQALEPMEGFKEGSDIDIQTYWVGALATVQKTGSLCE